ncbi:MAG: DUF1002 domain-containing protein [Eubacteriales bacterium]|nr:DUF1002 domain-containing protein [Eubacteriales bacterium]
MSKKKFAAALICGVCLSLGLSFSAFADASKVVTLGVDLSQEQKDTMMRYFNVSYDEVEVLYINNDDERAHLSAYVPLEQIGTRTFSCAYVKPTTSGGIRVKTANLSWVTCNMIATTLSTSGVTNCEVIAACPFQVSGTGALTGIIMAYETATGETLSEEKKELATEELVVTGELGDQIGQTDATAIVNEAKMEVLGEELQDREIIQSKVEEIADGKGYVLDDEVVEVLTDLLEKLAGQDYDYEEMQDTLEMVDGNVSGNDGTDEEIEILGGDDEIEDETDGVWAEEPETEDPDSILSGLDESILGENIISGSTDEKETEAVFDENEEVFGDDTWETEYIENIAPEETEYVENIAPEETEYVENIAPEETEFIEIVPAETEYFEPETEQYVESTEPQTEYVEVIETELPAETEDPLNPDYLDAEDRDAYDRVVKYCEKHFNDSDLDSDGNYKVPVDEETSKLAIDFIEELFLSMKLEGMGDFVPEDDAVYEDDELNYLDSKMQDLFLNGEEKIFEYYSAESCQEMYTSIMKFFCKVYEEDFPEEVDSQELDGLEELDGSDELDGFEELGGDGELEELG